MKVPVRKISLRRKIFLSNICIVFTAMCILAFLMIQLFTGYTVEAEQKSAKRELQLISNNLDTLLETTEDYLRVLTTDDSLTDALYEVKSHLDKSELVHLNERKILGRIVSNMIAPNTHIPCAAVLTEGRVLYAGYLLNDSEVYKVDPVLTDERIDQTQLPLWEEIHKLTYNTLEKEYVFPVSKKIMDKETGKILGAALFFLPEECIEQIYEKANVGNIFYITDRSGSIISSADKDVIGQEVGGKEKAGYLKSTYNYSKMNWNIVCYTNLTPLIEQRKKIVSIIIMILFILMLTSLFSAHRVIYMVTRPLEVLVRSLKDNGKNHSKFVQYTKNMQNNEIDYIGREFNNLLQELELTEQQNYEYQKARRKNELQLLQAQIKPHFLYNTMETIASLIKLDEKEQALEAVHNISKFYRKSLSKGREIITIADEKQLAECYLRIQSVRYYSRLEFEIDIPAELLGYCIPKLCLQPLIENALYHGIKKKTEKGSIYIRGYSNGENIRFEVFDTGAGIEAQELDRINQKLREHRDTSMRRGFGLYNVDERIRLLFGEDYGIHVESVYQEYTQVNLNIPVLTRGEVADYEITDS